MDLTVSFGILSAFALSSGVVVAKAVGRRVPRALRYLAALILFAFAGFCVFGFMATYEPPDYPVVRLTYGVLFAGCSFGMAWLLVPVGKRT
jgi:hypothetical protein